jgi:uncharacterized membrane protein YqhA
MVDQKLYSPIKIGLLIVVVSYFLFTLHALFTTQWIGEWNYLTGSFSFFIFVTDISALIGLIFRFIASIIAFFSVIFYFTKGLPSTAKTYKILRLILVLEAIYWLGLLTTTAMSIPGLNQSVTSFLRSLALNFIPLVVESIVLPIALFILAFKLNPNKPVKEPIKWALIAGTVYIFVFWLTNTSMWFVTLTFEKGTEYLTSYPQNLLSFILTTFGLLSLAIYTAYFSKKSIGTETLEKLKLKTIGAIIVALGLYFLWNYLTWIFFGRNEMWSNWYAWFLGHNLDLWVLSIPLVGLPLLFERKTS